MAEESILVVDDESVIRNLISKALLKEGFRCMQAEGVGQALDILDEKTISLVLADIKMPGRTGIELLDEIQVKHPDTKVVMVTTFDNTDTAIDCMRRGAVNYVTKPFRVEKLINTVNEALALRKEKLQEKEHYQQLETEVGKRIDEIRQASEELRTLDRKKKDFMANVSHELLTPLNVIIGFSEILTTDEVGAETRQDLLGSIYKEGKQLEKMLQELLAAAQCDSQIHLNKQPVNIPQLLDAAVLSMERQGDIRNYCKSLGSDCCKVIGDEMWLSQVLFSLLNNAVKFTSEKGQISVSCNRTDEGVLIQISDDGIGIPPEELNYIFEDFYQVGSSLVGKNPGLGLGLSLSRRIIELHDGKIWAESEGENKGSTFKILLPLAS